MGQFQRLARLLAESPELCTMFGMPQGVFAALPQLGALADEILSKREGVERRDFRRALVLGLLQGREAEFDVDPAAATKLVQDAQRIERVLDAVERDEREKLEQRERVKRDEVAAATIAADLIAEAQRERPIFNDCTFEGCGGVALDGELYCADHRPA